MSDDEPIAVDATYEYGFKGREMIAIIAPFPMSSDAAQIVGRRIRVGERVFRVMGVSRQISGQIHKGEPIGVEVQETPGFESLEPEPLHT